MPSKPSAAVAAAMKRDRVAPSEDSLEKVRQVLRDARDAERLKADLEERLKTVNENVFKLKHVTLPDLFDEVGIDKLGLPAEGNLPAYDTELKPYYKAAILADWEPERRQKAFDYLDRVKAGDLIKSVYIVALPRGNRAIAKKVQAALKKLKVEFTTDLSVPWNTLTAWVKESIEKHNTTPDLDALGATVGKVVNLKERKNG